MARVLIIEDNADNLELMTYLLEAFGHETRSVGSGRAGIVMAREMQPDLVVCDIHLPDGDGYTVAQALKSDPATSLIPLVAVTALAMVGDRARVLSAGFDSYITKPIDPERFVADLESFLGPSRILSPVSVESEPAEDPGLQISPRGTILVVDDTPANRDLMRDILEPFGFQVHTAVTAEEAMRTAQDIRPDLVISDLHMPSVDGFMLAKAIKAIPAMGDLPVIVLSSSTWNDADRATASRLGIARFLVRPIEPQALIDEISLCLSKKR
ncbi:response regulator [Tahibacter amnicola]|uniref:Response regulator n=1 Tax=Tahibacter amnicola TaxID=2976241 RepID=A0ABY6BJK3_9GAMM|nr:response regulator [Tahibacter amnicola]UXI70204.1 response regulator [Tahibacter amnicola]